MLKKLKEIKSFLLMQLIAVFNQVIDRRNFQLSHYENVSEDVFHQVVSDGTWSSEAIFRHLLMGMHWMENLLSKEKLTPHPLALVTGKCLESSVSIKDVTAALDEVTNRLISLISSQDDAYLKQETTTFDGRKSTLEKQVLGLILHETEHLGELKWIFKRLTGWDDNQMYKIKEKT
ncbi:MAG: DinB family protein [Candidatus Hodarchaeales archaeon]